MAGVTATSVRVRPPEISTVEGAEVQFTAEVFDERDQGLDSAPVEWSSDDPSIVTIDETGRARALRPGSTRIRASFNEVTEFAPVTVVPAPSDGDEGGGGSGGGDGSVVDEVMDVVDVVGGTLGLP